MMLNKSKQHAAFFSSTPNLREMERTRHEEQQVENQNSSARLSSLHTKLQLEAEKIRKWKLHTEIEIKQKDMKVQNANKTIESLRKSMLDLQLQNENLSLKLQEEVSSRTEIQKKIEATREMCNLLKGHSYKVEEKLHKCEKIKVELQKDGKEKSRCIRELGEHFQTLTITSKRTIAGMKKQLKQQVEEKLALQHKYNKDLEDAIKQLEDLDKLSQKKQARIESLSSELRINQQHLAELQQVHDKLQTRTCDLELAANDQKAELLRTEVELNEVQGARRMLEKTAADLTEKLQEASSRRERLEEELAALRDQHSRTTEDLNTQVNQLKTQLEQEEARCKELDEDCLLAKQKIECLKSDKDILMLERTEQATAAEEQYSALKNFMEDKIDELKKENEKLNKEKSSQEELVAQLSEAKQELEDTVEELESSNKASNKEISIIRKDNNKLRKDLEKAEKRENVLQEKLEEAEVQVRQLREQLEDFQNQLQATNEENLLRLTKEQKQTEKLKAELDNENKNMKALEGKAMTAQEEVKTQSKQIKDLEKELASQKKQTEKAQQAKQGMVKEMAWTLEKYKRDNDLIVADKDKELAALEAKFLRDSTATKQKHEKQIKEMERKMSLLQEDVQRLREEKAEILRSRSSFEEKSSTIASVLSTKESEIDELTRELEKLRTIHEESATTKKELKDSCDKLRKHETKLEKAQRDLQDAKEQLKETKKQLKSSEAEVKKMTGELLGAHKKAEGFQGRLDEATSKISEMEQHLKEAREEAASKAMEAERAQEEARQRAQEVEEARRVAQQREAEAAAAEQKAKQIAAEAEKTTQQARQAAAQAEDANMAAKLAPVETAVPMTPEVLHTPRQASCLPTPAKPNVRVASTPRTPTMRSVLQNGDLPTPMRTPINVANRSILRQVISSGKKRGRVAFAAKDKENRESGSCSCSDSSTSDLMEVEVEELEKQVRTPVRKTISVKPSPRAKASPATANSRIPLRPVPRGSPLKTPQQKKIRMEDKRKETADAQQNKESLAEKKNEPGLFSENAETPKVKKTGTARPNIRKTPNKTPGKFFLTSPKQRRKEKPSAQKEDLAWFDSDAVFGFGTED